jgi:Xaa-Pro aminopeptidase
VKSFIHASSEHCADLLHATGFRAPDPFSWVHGRGRPALLLNDLEIDRARRACPDAKIVSLSALEAKIARHHRRPSAARVIAAFLKSQKAKQVRVPADFPLALARALKRHGIRLHPAKGPFFPQRRIKTPDEVRALRRAARIAEAGMARAFEVLLASAIRRDGRLAWGRRVLTSELLRIEIAMAVVRAGGESRMDAIVACGEQACDPHEKGSGPIRANELLILDIFPRDPSSGFFGDITRTVVRGKPSDACRELWELCLEGQRRALRAIKPGAGGARIQKDIKKFFRKHGRPDEIHEGRWRGFFHGLGHGLGLEIHEEPRLSATDFEPGEVLTVEPGLYWPGVGGVRHEDVVVVTQRGCRLLTRHPKPLELQAAAISSSER